MTLRHAKRNQHIWDQFDNEFGVQNNLEDYCTPSSEREHCDKCHSRVKMSEDGFNICSNSECSRMFTDVIDSSAEWRFYGLEDNHGSNPTRCGMPTNPLLQESSMGGCKVICSSKVNYKMRKISRFANWHAMPYKEHSQYNDFQIITIHANNSGISKMIVEEACRYYKQISEKKTFRGLNRDGIVAASIYIACRIENFPRTAKEIAKIFVLDFTSATKGCKNAMSIINELELNNTACQEQITYTQTNPIAFIERYSSKLNLNRELTKLAQFVALQIEKNNWIPENTPNSVAAGIIYFISQEFNLGLTKHDVQTVSEISEVTINKCYKKIFKLKDALIPSGIRDKYKI